MARSFAEAGATVALVARSAETVAFARRRPRRHRARRRSGRPRPGGTPLIGRIEDEAGPVDVLVNNAGIESSAGFADAPDGELKPRVTQVNYLAPAELCRRATPRMLSRGGFDIVNISSMGGHRDLSRPRQLRRVQGGAVALHLGAAHRPAGSADRDDARRTRSGADRPARQGRRLRADTRQLRPALPAAPAQGHAEEKRWPPAIVEAVRKDRRHVRIPRRAALFPCLVEAPTAPLGVDPQRCGAPAALTAE